MKGIYFINIRNILYSNNETYFFILFNLNINQVNLNHLLALNVNCFQYYLLGL